MTNYFLMNNIDFDNLVKSLVGQKVDRPNKSSNGTLSGHAAGEPFEKLTYHILKEQYPTNIFKQFEFLNDIYLRHPRHITVKDRYSLLESPVALFLLNRGDKATKEWAPYNIFEERQNDTADILWHDNNYFDIIDIKTRNMAKSAMPPNIISAYKLAKTCAIMIDNNDYSSVGIHYVEIEWREFGEYLECCDACWKDLFKSCPTELYINWAAAMQIQFHVNELNQNFNYNIKEWAYEYLRCFVSSAEKRCQRMYDTYVRPFKKYL